MLKNVSVLWNSIIVLFSCIVLAGCESEDYSPIIQTDMTVENITASSATSGGIVIDDKGYTVVRRGVCWGLNPNPTIEKDSFTVDGSGAGKFVSQMRFLSHNKSYFVRAYATNKHGTSYGNTISFKTLEGVAGLFTISFDSLRARSVVFKGEVIEDGGDEIFERGFCVSLKPNPTISDRKVVSGEGLGSFTAHIDELSPFTQYYVRSFATNNVTTSYGNELDFVTRDGIISITTKPVSDVSVSSFLTGGFISDDGGSSVLERGVCWSENRNPKIDNNSVNTLELYDSQYSIVISNLKHSTKYFVRSYAINDVGISYGDELEVNTRSGEIVLTTLGVTGVTRTAAQLNGRIVDDGGSDVIEKGFTFSLDSIPSINDSRIIVDFENNLYHTQVKDLIPSTKYFVTSYAVNSIGMFYGNQVWFKTNEDLIGGNLVQNGDFSAPWTSGVPAGWSVDFTDRITITQGSGSFIVTNPTGTTKFFQEIEVEAGATYELKFDYTATHLKFRIWSGFRVESGGQITYQTATNTTDPLRTNNGYFSVESSFKTMTYTFTVPANQTLFLLEYRYYTQAASSFELKNVSLVKQ